MKIGRLFLFAGLILLARCYAWGKDAPAYLSVLLQEAHAQHLAETREWRGLLHYQPDVLRRVHSDITAPAFFFSPHGRTDPRAELEATLTAFFEAVVVGTDTQHPQCRFPAQGQRRHQCCNYANREQLLHRQPPLSVVVW